MYKSILAILLIGLLAAPAMAVPPPGGWGNDCSKWQNEGGSFYEFALHNDTPPDYCGDFWGWTVFIGNEAQEYPFLAVGTLELWIELYASMTCYNTHWQFHYLSTPGEPGQPAFNIEFEICGVVASNSEIQVAITGDGQNMAVMRFIENIFGVDDNSGRDYAVLWEKASGEGAVIPDDKEWESASSEVAETGAITFQFPKCDHWWCIKGSFCVLYHEADGYWLLSLVSLPMPIL
jgi:hypothetical protein